MGGSSSKRLTRAEAEEVRRRYAGPETQAQLALAFGVSQAAISAIVRGRSHIFQPLSEEERRARKRNGAYLSIYGISYDDWQQMLSAAKYACEACGGRLEDQTPHHRSGVPSLRLDHDHLTGKLRGVLCNGCNLVLGHVEDSIERLEGLVTYLKTHGAS